MRWPILWILPLILLLVPLINAKAEPIVAQGSCETNQTDLFAVIEEEQGGMATGVMSDIVVPNCITLCLDKIGNLSRDVSISRNGPKVLVTVESDLPINKQYLNPDETLIEVRPASVGDHWIKWSYWHTLSNGSKVQVILVSDVRVLDCSKFWFKVKSLEEHTYRIAGPGVGGNLAVMNESGLLSPVRIVLKGDVENVIVYEFHNGMNIPVRVSLQRVSEGQWYLMPDEEQFVLQPGESRIIRVFAKPPGASWIMTPYIWGHGIAQDVKIVAESSSSEESRTLMTTRKITTTETKASETTPQITFSATASWVTETKTVPITKTIIERTTVVEKPQGDNLIPSLIIGIAIVTAAIFLFLREGRK